MTAFFKQLPQVLLLYKKHKAKARAFHKGKRVAGKTQSSKVMFSKKLTKDIIFEVGEELPITVEYIWFVLNYPIAMHRRKLTFSGITEEWTSV
jgi:hypothetical protein